MKYFLLIIFLPLLAFAQSKDDLLQGTWVKAKAEMKDGSRIVDHNGCGMEFLKYSFGPDGVASIGSEVLFDGFKTKYKLLGDSLVIGGTIYNVIGITKDTIKLSFFAPGLEDSQLPLYSFVKVPGSNSHTSAVFDAGLKDSVYQANNVFFRSARVVFLACFRRYQINLIRAQ